MSTRQVQVRITGDPARLGAAFRQSSRDARGFGASVRGHVAGAAGVAARSVAYLGAGLTVAAGVGFKKALDAAGDFEQTLNVFQATAGATGDQMRRVSDVAIKLGADTKLPGTSAADAAQAMTELAKGGLDVAQAMDAARGTLQLSAAAQISNADAATIVADNLNAFGLAGTEAARVADLLAASANATTASMPEMADALKQSAAVASAMGIPIEELVTELGQLANAGIKGSDAGTSVKTMLLSLTAPSNKASRLMQDLGVKVFDAQGKFRGMPSVISDFNRGLRGMSDAQRAATLKTIFGTDAIRAANIILGQSKDKHDKLYDAVTKTGAASDLAASQTKGWKGALGGFQSTMETLAIQLGTKALPAATDFVNFISANLPGAVDAAVSAVTPLVGTISDVAGAVADVAQRIAEADGTGAKVSIVLDVAKEQLGKVKDAVLGVDWDGVGETIGEKLGDGLDTVRAAVEEIDWDGVGTTIGEKVGAGIGRLGDAVGQVDWSAVGGAISDGIEQGIDLSQDAAARIVTTLAGAMVANRGVVADAGAQLGLAILSVLTDPGFWAEHWQEALGVALAVFPVGKGVVLGEKVAAVMLRPFARIGGRLGGFLLRGLEEGALAVAIPAERIGGRIVSGAARGVVAAGDWLTRPLRAGLNRLGPVGRWISQRVSNGISGAGGLVRRAGHGLVTRAVNGILSAPGAVRGAARRIGSIVVEGMQNGWRRLPRLARSLIATGVVNVITSLVSSAFSAALRLGGRVKDGVVDGVTGVKNRVEEIVGRIPGALEDLVGEVSSAAAEIGGAIYSSIIGGIGDIGGYVAGKVRDAVNSVISLINGIGIGQRSYSFHVPGFKVSTPVGEVGFGGRDIGFTVGPYDLPDIPRLAKGGIVKARPGGTLILAGEAGRDELVEPLPRGGVLNRGGGGDTHLHFHTGKVIGDRDLEDIVVAALNRTAKRNGRVLRAGIVKAY